MRFNSFAVLMLLFSLPMAKGQVFAFIQNEGGSNSSEAVTSYKFNVVNKIFNELLKARGDYRMQAPKLVMNKRERYVAWMDPEQVQIGLEEKAYNICTSFGSDSLNAIAALISHELTHYYEKHDWNRHFVRENEDIETSRQLERLEEGLKQEAQADYLGGFLAYSVGYNTYGIMPELLKKVYQSYRLPENLTGYPVLKDRLSMVDGAMTRLKELSVMFELSQMLTILGNYEDAATYHRSILQSYQSREIYNNAGVNSVLAALEFFGPTELPYILPLELDPKSRLTGSKNVIVDRLEKRKSILLSAVKQFEQALALDENYTTAYLNKGCALTLLGEYEDADYWIKKGIKKCSVQKMTTDFLVMQGISAALQGDKTTAAKYLEQAKTIGSYLATTNLNILGDKSPVPSTTPPLKVSAVEQIEWYRLSDFLANPNVDRQVTVSENILCGIQQRPQSRIYIHYANNGTQYAVIQETTPDYKGATQRAITLKSSADNIQEAYGVPKSNIGLPDGNVWVYPEANIFFRFNPKGILQSWGVYLKSTE